MLGNYFKETFCDMTKTKVCATSMEVDFNFYTDPGIYEIYEDCGTAQICLYLLLVDKTARGTTTQMRLHCGSVEWREQEMTGTWGEWQQITGSGAECAVAVGTGVGSVVQVVSEEYVQPKATARSSSAFGEGTEAKGVWSHAQGYLTKALSECAHAEGNSTEANGRYTHSEGVGTKAYGKGSHAEGSNTVAGIVNESAANARFAHAEGGETIASGLYSHAEGQYSKANGNLSHAEGYGSEVPLTQELDAEGNLSYGEDGNPVYSKGAHAEGWKTIAYRNGAHSEGNQTEALGIGSHAEGGYTEARCKYSHAGGRGTIAARNNQCVIGQYNEISETALFIVGCGTDEENRKNAFMVDLDADGNLTYDFGGARFTPDMMQSVLSLASMSVAEGVEF